MRILCLFPMIVIAACAGCYPDPHTEWSIPEISGSYSAGGRAAPGVSVLLGYSAEERGRCDRLKKVAVTDHEGRFHVRPVTHQAILRDAINGDHVSQVHHICFGDSGHQVYGGEFVTSRLRYQHLVLSCNSPPLRMGRTAIDRGKVCR